MAIPSADFMMSATRFILGVQHLSYSISRSRTLICSKTKHQQRPCHGRAWFEVLVKTVASVHFNTQQICNNEPTKQGIKQQNAMGNTEAIPIAYFTLCRCFYYTNAIKLYGGKRPLLFRYDRSYMDIHTNEVWPQSLSSSYHAESVLWVSTPLGTRWSVTVGTSLAIVTSLTLAFISAPERWYRHE